MKTVNNYVKSIAAEPDELGRYEEKYRFFDSKNSKDVSKVRIWAENEALKARRVSVWEKIAGLSGRYPVPEIGEEVSN